MVCEYKVAPNNSGCNVLIKYGKVSIGKIKLNACNPYRYIKLETNLFLNNVIILLFIDINFLVLFLFGPVKIT